jgi:hypothetical protein
LGLKNMSINVGGTLANTGGTAKVFADDGVTVPNGVHVSVPGTADFRVREHATFRYSPPVLQADGTYTRQNNRVSLTIPKALAAGGYVNNTIRIEVDIHPESTATEALDLRKLAAQTLFDSDTDNFWVAGSLS